MGLTQEQLHKVLHYDPDTGDFWWKEKKSGRHMTKPAGGKSGRYLQIQLWKGAQFYAHRLAWLYVYGTWPPECIDHSNGDGLDNRVANLRLASKKQNARNAKKGKNNTSGYKGICFDKGKQKWMAKTCKDYKQIFIGYFDCPKQAHEAYVNKIKELHGEFANGGAGE